MLISRIISIKYQDFYLGDNLLENLIRTGHKQCQHSERLARETAAYGRCNDPAEPFDDCDRTIIYKSCRDPYEEKDPDNYFKYFLGGAGLARFAATTCLAAIGKADTPRTI